MERQMARVKLGTQGLEVSKIGFGCMGLTGVYNDPVPEDAGVAVIRRAFDAGVTFFDTADAYGPHTNEVLLGKALRQVPRERVQVATKCGIAVHPITAVQMEWSLWTRDIEEDIIPLCRELGIGVVPYSPLGRGFFAGRAAVESLPSGSLLSKHPRYTGENLEKNRVLYTRLEMLSTKYGCTPAQLALAWVLHQGDDVVPIPGTTKLKNLDDNIEAVKVKLSKEDLKEISAAIPAGEVAGSRIIGILEPYSWRVANTPPQK
ncbi:unnamed protein product [Triticum turgidum subsp. durum]|uniref:NADP-dependent oxidoreductase domain-containing protein n=1 Tax=Triticum turgidum subsp. durum TaxID=4567 RepID=A0A9R1BXI3_TRITD|nr:unnamed protein product [Triticum turgidum subsp. durum]